jgi:CRISPR-associated protein Csd1
MILQSLHALHDRLRDDAGYRIPPRGYSLQKISFKVVLRPDGSLFGIQDMRIPSNGKLRAQQLIVPGNTKPSGSGINPGFLWDTTEYMLGFKAGDRNPRRTKRAFEAYREKHLEIADQIGSPSFQAVCRFLESWNRADASQHPVLLQGDVGYGVFQLLGETSYVHQDSDVQSWWETNQSRPEDVPCGQCLVTGAFEPIAVTHPKIKGIFGGQAAGAVIVGFNEDAYESYGKKQSHNAPVSEEAAFRYTTALNALLDGPMRTKHRVVIGDAMVVFWTERPTPTEDIFAIFASSGSVKVERAEIQDAALLEKLEAFLAALRRGREAYAELEDDPDHTPFFLLGLAPNAARISVRFFHRGTLSELLDNLRAHYDDIRIQPQPAAGRRPADPEYPPISMLLDQTCPWKEGRPDREKIPPVLAGPLLRSIVTGVPYPDGLYSAVIRRIHADRAINYPRACVIKGYLTRNRKKEVTMTLEPERPDPAYRLGRLFAALEKTQIDALGTGLSATVRDRFYSSASATPRSVFPRLLRTYQHHLAKLEGGHKVNREKLVQEILDPLVDFPANLDLAGQGLFALGYYHQTRSFYTRKETSARPDSNETEMEAP